MARAPVVSINLPDDLPHGAYAAIVADTKIEGDVNVRFRFGAADYWVYQNGVTFKIGEIE